MRALPILASFLLAVSQAAAAEEARCTPSVEGAVACLAGKLCLCRHDGGGVLTGRGPGMRWDCGAFRPACGPAGDAAARDSAPPPPPLPVQPILPYPPQSPPWQ